MIPIKTKSLYSEIASELCMEVNTVEKINEFYWHSVREHLSELKTPSILISGLGSFHLKGWHLNKTISKLKQKVVKWNIDAERKPIYDNYNQDLMRALNVQILWNKELKRKEYYKLKKTAYKNGKSVSNMEI